MIEETKTKISIHEFSTGIEYERTSDHWISRGYLGQYMNSTLAKVPEAVEKAIRNSEFSIAEKASRLEPALIGREVVGEDGEQWSVLAVVTA